MVAGVTDFGEWDLNNRCETSSNSFTNIRIAGMTSYAASKWVPYKTSSFVDTDRFLLKQSRSNTCCWVHTDRDWSWKKRYSTVCNPSRWVPSRPYDRWGILKSRLVGSVKTDLATAKDAIHPDMDVLKPGVSHCLVVSVSDSLVNVNLAFFSTRKFGQGYWKAPYLLPRTLLLALVEDEFYFLTLYQAWVKCVDECSPRNRRCKRASGAVHRCDAWFGGSSKTRRCCKIEKAESAQSWILKFEAEIVMSSVTICRKVVNASVHHTFFFLSKIVFWM